MARDPVRWYEPNAADNPPFLRALAEVRNIVSMKAGVITTSKRSCYPLINTRKLRRTTKSFLE